VFYALRHHFLSGASYALVVLLLFTLPVQANVTSVTPTPSSINIPSRGAANINVTWRVVWFDAAAFGSGTITSTNAQLQINGSTIANIGGALSQNTTTAPNDTLNFNETLTLTPELARRVATASPGSVSIVRTFTDTFLPGTGTIQVSTGAAGPLAVRRIELHFENDARTDVVRKGDMIRAVAEVNFRNNGLLRGEWRIVDPATNLGVGRGRVLQVVRQQLISSGEGRTRIVSPPLPTKTNGLHLISFTVEDTDGNIAIPILRYFVLEGSSDEVPENLSALTPGNNANIDEDTVFSWKPLPGASAYQLEIFETDSQTLVTGKVVPGTDLKLNLSHLTLDNLASGQNYDWHIRAFDKNGKTLGKTPRMILHMP
jgi:hypothetical protein